MKKAAFTTLIILALSFTLAAQQPTPTPVSDDAVVKISTDLIQVDATVIDKTGKIIKDLKPEDFELYENGQLQKISNFSFISRIAGGASVGDRTVSGQSGGTVKPITASEVRRTIAVVVDDLNLSFVSIYYTRKTLHRFVDEQMLSNDLVAIIKTGGGVGALQQFTSDKRLLHAAIDKLTWNPFGSGGADALASVGQNDQDVSERFSGESDVIANMQAGPKQTKSILRSENVADKKRTDLDVTKNSSEQEVGLYAQASLGTIKYIISGMDPLPGRKVMMLFSDGIRIGNESNKSRTSSVYGFLQDVVAAANRSSVVVYTFDTKGLRSMSVEAADNTYEVIDGHREQKLAERDAAFKSSQDGLVYFANQTGGKATLNSSDLNGGISRALDEQEGYYLLGYQPDADAFSPGERRFNKLEIKVKRPGAKVSYRSGFFNHDEPTAAVATQAAVDKAISSALTSPFASNDIGLAANALYASDPNDGAYIRSFLHIDARNLKFVEDAEGWKKATFDVAAVTFGDNGVPVENAQTTYTIKTKGATYDTMLQKGFVYTLIVPVKKPGVYQFRVALRDTATGKIGSARQIIDIPDVSKRKITMSTIAVENVSKTTWEYITQGKIGSGPGQVQVPSTLLYDTVLRQFPANSVLRYGFEVYNAKFDGSQTAKLETQAKILQNDKVIVEGSINKHESVAQNAGAIPRISGAILLKETLPPGDYVLHLSVRDMLSRQVATQAFPFEVIK
jgi:VWFA-related protein